MLDAAAGPVVSQGVEVGPVIYRRVCEHAGTPQGFHPESSKSSICLACPLSFLGSAPTGQTPQPDTKERPKKNLLLFSTRRGEAVGSKEGPGGGLGQFRALVLDMPFASQTRVQVSGSGFGASD